jgi:hypothetical protein
MGFVRELSYIIRMSSTYLLYRQILLVSRMFFMLFFSCCYRKISAMGDPIATPLSGW